MFRNKVNPNKNPLMEVQELMKVQECREFEEITIEDKKKLRKEYSDNMDVNQYIDWLEEKLISLRRLHNED